MALQQPSYREVITLAQRRRQQSSHWPGSIAAAIIITVCALMVIGLASVPRAERAPAERRAK